MFHTAGATPGDSSTARIFDVDVLGTAYVLDAFEPYVQPGTVAVCIASMAGTMADFPADVLHAMATTPTDSLGALWVPALAELPSAVRTRVLRLAALAAGAPPGSLSAVHIGALDALVTGWHGQGQIDLPGGVAATRSYDRVLLAARRPAPENRQPEA